MNLKEFVNVQNMTFKSSESCFFFSGMTDVRIKEKKEWKVRINTFFMTGVGNHVVFYNYIYIYIDPTLQKKYDYENSNERT